MVGALEDPRRSRLDVSRHIERRFHEDGAVHTERLHLRRIADWWVGEERRLLLHGPDRDRRRHGGAGRLGPTPPEPDRVREAAQERREVYAARSEGLVQREALRQIGAPGAIPPRARCGDTPHQQRVQPFAVGWMREIGRASCREREWVSGGAGSYK